MSDLFAEQLQALRTRSLHRKLREIGSAQGSIVDLVRRRFGKIDIVTRANEIARPRLISIEPDEFSSNQLLNPRTGQLRQCAGQKAIQAQTGSFFRRDERDLGLFGLLQFKSEC